MTDEEFKAIIAHSNKIIKKLHERLELIEMHVVHARDGLITYEEGISKIYDLIIENMSEKEIESLSGSTE